MIALAAQQQWHMTSVDVKTAFLYGELDEELFMEQPEGFAIKGQEHKVFRLKCALYMLRSQDLKVQHAQVVGLASVKCLLEVVGLVVSNAYWKL